MADNETRLDYFGQAADDEMLGFSTPVFPIFPRSQEPKLMVSGPQALIDWLEGRDLKRLPTDETPHAL